MISGDVTLNTTSLDLFTAKVSANTPEDVKLLLHLDYGDSAAWHDDQTICMTPSGLPKVAQEAGNQVKG